MYHDLLSVSRLSLAHQCSAECAHMAVMYINPSCRLIQRLTQYPMNQSCS